MIELLCIQTHSQKAVIAGNVYPLISDKCPCNCDGVDVGLVAKMKSGRIPKMGENILCGECNTRFINDGKWWMAKELFAQIGEKDEHEAYDNKEVLTTIEEPIEV